MRSTNSYAFVRRRPSYQNGDPMGVLDGAVRERRQAISPAAFLPARHQPPPAPLVRPRLHRRQAKLWRAVLAQERRAGTSPAPTGLDSR